MGIKLAAHGKCICLLAIIRCNRSIKAATFTALQGTAQLHGSRLKVFAAATSNKHQNGYENDYDPFQFDPAFIQNAVGHAHNAMYEPAGKI